MNTPTPRPSLLTDEDIKFLAKAAKLPKLMHDTEGFRECLGRFAGAVLERHQTAITPSPGEKDEAATTAKAVKVALDAAMAGDWRKTIATLDTLDSYLSTPSPAVQAQPARAIDMLDKDAPRHSINEVNRMLRSLAHSAKSFGLEVVVSVDGEPSLRAAQAQPGIVSDVELPPLPEADGPAWGASDPPCSFNADKVRSYALSAVEKDRQSRAQSSNHLQDKAVSGESTVPAHAAPTYLSPVIETIPLYSSSQFSSEGD